MYNKRDLLRIWRKNGFKLELFDTHRRDMDGKSILAYRFFDKKEPIFEGEDFHPSPLFAIDSIQCAYALLVFFAQKPGESGMEFDDYTARQYEWAESSRCDDLAALLPYS